MGRANSEIDRLTDVMVHKPGVETLLGTLDPEPNLFLSSFNWYEAYKEHDNFVEILEKEKINVHYLSNLVINHKDFEKEFMNKIYLDPQLSVMERKDIYQSLQKVDKTSKFQVMILNAFLSREKEDSSVMDLNFNQNVRQMKSRIVINGPLSNLYFMRDQQFLTNKGMVLCRMKMPTRRPEPEITKLALESYGEIDIVHEIRAPGTIEGGEFFPFGDLAFIGVGYQENNILYGRTNMEAVQQVLNTKVMDYDEVFVVESPIPFVRKVYKVKPQEEGMVIMHLDTWFNLPSKNQVVVYPEMAEAARVYCYTKDSGEYVKRETTTLMDIIKEKDYQVLPISYEEQKYSASNFLTISDGKIIPINLMHLGTNYPKRLIKEGLDLVPGDEGINVINLTKGYGGIHCMTGVLNRS